MHGRNPRTIGEFAMLATKSANPTLENRDVAPFADDGQRNPSGQELRPSRLPRIDYDSHPAYGKLFPAPGLGLRIAALRQLLPAVARFTAITLLHAGRAAFRLRPTRQGSRPFFRDGVEALRIPSEAKAALLEAAAPFVATLSERRAATPVDRRSYDDAQLAISREGDGARLYRLVENVLAGFEVLELSRNYVRGAAGRVHRVTLQINDEGEQFWRERFGDVGLPDPPANYFHVDTGVGTIKALIYLSEVGPMSGPFSYVPGTQKFRPRFWEGILRRAMDFSQLSGVTRNERELFYALPRSLRQKADFGVDLLGHEAEAQWILRHKTTFTSSMGDLLIFDNAGMHQGGMVQSGQRRILQVILK